MTVSREAPVRHADAALDLVAAAAPFLKRNRLVTDAARERFRSALIALVRVRGGLPPACLVATQAEALDALRAIVARCEALHVPWVDVVAIVNREQRFPSDSADPRGAARGRAA
jgi:hypothetical protein